MDMFLSFLNPLLNQSSTSSVVAAIGGGMGATEGGSSVNGAAAEAVGPLGSGPFGTSAGGTGDGGGMPIP